MKYFKREFLTACKQKSRFDNLHKWLWLHAVHRSPKPAHNTAFSNLECLDGFETSFVVLPLSMTQSHKLAVCCQFGFHSLLVSQPCADVWCALEEGRMGKCDFKMWNSFGECVLKQEEQRAQNLIYKDFGCSSILLGSWGGCFSSET